MMQPQTDLFDRAYELLNKSLEAQAVLRYLESKWQLASDLYVWMSAACWANFEAESEALANQYREVLDAPEIDEVKAN